jgi:hypothetical protein
MRHINQVLKSLVIFIFITIPFATAIALMFFQNSREFKQLGLSPWLSVLVLGVVVLVLLSIFSILCPLLEIAENTRKLSDSIQISSKGWKDFNSGALKVVVVQDDRSPRPSSFKEDKLSLEPGLEESLSIQEKK